MIDALDSQIKNYSSDLEQAVCADDIHRIVENGLIAVLFGLEGGHIIGDSLENLHEFYERGVRYMTLTWNNSNSWADSSNDKPLHRGLTHFGREVVQEMNRLGMIVDVSHSSDETFRDVLEVTQAPIMASHSSVRALVDNPRNLSDDMLQAIAGNGGIAMINFGGPFIDSRKTTWWKLIRDIVTHLGPSPVLLSLLIDHIDHAVSVAGINHVGLGSDFDGALLYPDGVKDVSGFPNVTAGLVERGYSMIDIRKVLGENMLRVFKQVEAVAH